MEDPPLLKVRQEKSLSFRDEGSYLLYLLVDNILSLSFSIIYITIYQHIYMKKKERNGEEKLRKKEKGRNE